jgi:hypothetical protein
MRVLVIDRHDRNRRRLARAFEHANVDAVIERGIDAAVRQLEREPFDVLLITLRREVGPNPFPELSVIPSQESAGFVSWSGWMRRETPSFAALVWLTAETNVS